MKNFRKNVIKSRNGITLIALVITIIVLLILAGISISMLSGNNGLLQRATDAKIKSDETQIRERIQLSYHSALIEGQGSYTKESLEDELEKEFGEDFEEVDDSNDTSWILKAGGQSVTIPAGKIVPKITTYTVYSIGDKVTIGDETFFVIEDSDETKSTVRLITKENINLTNLVQSASASASTVAFSTTNYWVDANSDNTKCKYGNYPANVITDTDVLSTDGKTAVYAAQEYGKKIGAEIGTLLTLTEAQGLGRSYESLLFANSGEYKSENNALNFWTGTVAYGVGVLGVTGAETNIVYRDYNNNSSFGVRPVIEILKSKIND